MLKTVFVLIGLLPALLSPAQRSYKSVAVLASGNWYKIAVSRSGIYKVDLSLLRSLGINTGNITTSSIRLFGNGGAMLPEANNMPVTDDLEENAIHVIDGGDGIFNGGDYFLFYAPGPDRWLKDSARARFRYEENIYSDKSFYFIHIGGEGKRIRKISRNLQPNNVVQTYHERYHHEQETVNFLNSGKNWYGEEFGFGQAKTPARNFTIPLTGMAGQDVTLVSSCISRSVGLPASFNILYGQVPVAQHNFDALSSSNLDLFARSSEVSAVFRASAGNTITYAFQPSVQGPQGWLNWFDLFYRKGLTMGGQNQVMFRDWNSAGTGKINEFVIQEAGQGVTVWNVTNPLEPLQMDAVATGPALKFTDEGSSLQEYIAFDGVGYLLPERIGRVANQDLHGSSRADMLIVTYEKFLSQAQRLAEHHTAKDNLKVVVVTTEQVFNEFASGSPDPAAIRNFVKMYYDRAGQDTTLRPRYLLLFGDASYDYKNRLENNTSFVPAYQSEQSLDPLGTYTSDDYFGFLDDNDNILNDSALSLLDIGIGRIPAATAEQARQYVDKIIAYASPATLGDWRNHLTFIADDEDNNLHLRDAEVLTAAASVSNPLLNLKKIYLDAYPQLSDPAGSRYPAVNDEIHRQMQKGMLIWNYSGHGGFRRLAEEVVLDADIVSSWDNAGRLPLFITATCDFAPFDNPSIHSLGEDILFRQQTGAIALMTTTRLVFAYSNRVMNRNYLEAALLPGANGKYPALGEALKTAKNTTYRTSDIANNRKFTLLGDPALTLAFPLYRIRTDSVNGLPAGVVPDTLKALQTCTVAGSVTDVHGNLVENFNGTVYPSVFDKVRTVRTRGNDVTSPVENFEVRDQLLFKGKASVKNGRFSFEFIVPQDINYTYGPGKVSYYAENGSLDGNGTYTRLIIGGSQAPLQDNTGPEISVLAGGKILENGAELFDRAVLQILLKDISGINIAHGGIDHGITVIINNDPEKKFVLNEWFEADLDSFQHGAVLFTLPHLEEGIHSIRIKAWDGMNNSNEVSYSFRIKMKRDYSILRLKNFPNPLTTATTFRLQHDVDAPEFKVDIEIYAADGRLVKTLGRTIINSRDRSFDITWDGSSREGFMLPRGIYFYIARITTPGGAKTARSAKMVIL